MKSDLHERIANVLGWEPEDVHTMSLPTLREIVRTVDPDLYREISSVLEAGTHFFVKAPKARKRY